MSSKPRCPRCGSELEVKTESNPVRNVVRETISCRNCGYRDTGEHAPDLTLGDWLKKKKP